jgi:hypothetical protein
MLWAVNSSPRARRTIAAAPQLTGRMTIAGGPPACWSRLRRRPSPWPLLVLLLSSVRNSPRQRRRPPLTAARRGSAAGHSDLRHLLLAKRRRRATFSRPNATATAPAPGSGSGGLGRLYRRSAPMIWQENSAMARRSSAMARRSLAMEERGSRTGATERVWRGGAQPWRRGARGQPEQVAGIEVDGGRSSGGRRPEQVARAVVAGTGAGKEVVVVGDG